MNTPSDRWELQQWFETHLGCRLPEHWSSLRPRLEAFTFDAVSLPDIRAAMVSDALGLYERSVISLAGALESAENGYAGWAQVKSYYTTYYSVRALMILRGHCLVRNMCWYHAFLPDSPKGLQKLNSKRFRNDHETALNLYLDYYKKSDWTLSNSIDGQPTIEWIMEVRNDSNYRTARFSDPLWPRGFKPFIDDQFSGSIESLITTLLSDSSRIRYFLPEYAWIGIPVAQLISVSDTLKVSGTLWTIRSDRLHHCTQVFNRLPEKLKSALVPPCAAEK